jgi:acyl-coenzyme A thioesterase PaaI-like protein
MSEDNNSEKSNSDSDRSVWSNPGDSVIPSPLALPRHRVSMHDADNPRLRLANATREVLQHSATSVAQADVFAQAAALLEQAAALLEPGPHGRSYHASAEGAVGGATHGFISHSPVTGPLNGLAGLIELESTATEIIATVAYGDAYEGPPGCLHGGLIAAIFDEVLGFAQALSGSPGMTGRLEVTYRSPTPLHQTLKVTGRFDGMNGRKIMTSGEIYAGDRLCAQAIGTFISVKAEKFAALNLDRQTRD